MQTIEIQLSKFGEVFSSRPEGREVALSIIAYHFDKKKYESIILDFKDVKIMTPSWLSEFMQSLKQHGVKNIGFKNETNASVISSIEMVAEENSSSVP